MTTKKTTTAKTSKRRKATAPAGLAELKLERGRTALETERTKLEIQRRKLARLEAEDKRAAEGEPFRTPFEQTAEDLGARLGLGEHTIAGLMREPDAPQKGPEGYNVRAWGQWLLRRRRTSPVDDELRAAKARLAAENLRARKMENERREGRLMPLDDAVTGIKQYAQIVVDAIRDVVARGKMRGVPPVVLEVVEEVKEEIEAEARRRVFALVESAKAEAAKP